MAFMSNRAFDDSRTNTCREIELSGKMATKRHSFFSDASVKRTPNTEKVAGMIPGESDFGM
jgi:hypothetical protein